MKTAKKIIKTILALLPLTGMMVLFLTSFNAKTEQYDNFSRVRIIQSSSTPYLVFDVPQATNARLLGSLYSSNYNVGDGSEIGSADEIKGAMATLLKFAYNLNNITGIPPTFLLVILWYAFYLFMIEFVFMIVNIITFVPRKCSEFFGG